MKPLTLFLLVLIAIAAPTRGHASAVDDPVAVKAWEDLCAAIDAGDDKQIRSFLGKRISVEAGREQISPALVLSAELLDKSRMMIRVTQSAPGSPGYGSVHRAQRWVGSFVDVRILGVIRAIDRKKREMLIDLIRAE
jgi:hypothetical protein